MKKTSLFSILFVLTLGMLSTAFGINPPSDSITLKGSSNTWLGDYQIKELPATTENGQLMRTFELSYAKAEKKVLIYLDQRPDCREYIVRSKNLEVKYVCNKSGFGAKLVTGKLRKYDPAVNELFLSKEEFKNQSKISEGGLEASSALGLIASYYPSLMKQSNLLD
jgi:hypothetical protein